MSSESRRRGTAESTRPGSDVDTGRPPRNRRCVPKEKEPGMAIEEAKGRLRLEEIEEEAARCGACAKARHESGDASAFCPEHLKKIFGV